MTGLPDKTGLPQNIEDLLVRLADSSRGEINLIRTLADAIRRVDDQLLREVRSVTLQHELRREAILDELQTLATRLCCLPAKTTASPIRATIEQQPDVPQHPVETAPMNGNGADWRQATQNIHDELEFAFNPPSPRH